jgi:hypothetical protein
MAPAVAGFYLSYRDPAHARAAYDQYRVTVIGSVPIKMQFGNSQEIEMRKIAFCLRGEIDKSTLHQKPREKLAEDGRLNAYGADGRKPRPISATALLPSLTAEHSSTTT